MIRWILSLIFCALFFGCTPTNQNLAELTGEATTTTTKTVNGPLGNSALSFSPSSKDFGTLAANSGSTSQTFTVTNTSVYTIYLGTLSGATTDFTVTANTCSNGLALTPNGFCSITVQFAPLTTGTLSTAFAVPYDTTLGVNSFASSVGVNGAGTTLTGFSGLTTISAINITDVTLNWTDAGVNAGSYQTYQINATGGAILIGNLTRAAVCALGACAAQVTGLNPSTAYTFRVRATDTNLVQEQNIVNQGTTTLAGNLDLWMSSASTAAGICLQATVTAENSVGTPFNITTASTISITGVGSGSLFSNSICTLALANPTISAGTSAAIFYFKDTLKESLTVTASLSTYGGDSHSLSVTAASADRLVAISGNGLSTRVNDSLSTAAAIKVVDFYGNGVSGEVLSIFDMFGYGGKPVSTTLTTDANGLASTLASAGSIGINETFVIQRIGTVLPDAAASGNARLYYTNTQTTTNSGIFLGLNATGTGPTEGTTGDFNGDGKQDVVTTNYTGNTISFLAGNGNGSFALKTDTASCAAPYGIVSGYFNGDAILDIAVNCYSVALMGVQMGVGDGTFGAVTTYAAGTNPYGITSANLDGVNGNDLVVVNYTSNTISVYLNNGNGTYAAKVDYASGTGPVDVWTADINGDGASDILTTNLGADTFSVLVNNNNGTGTFVAKVDYATGIDPYDIRSGLLNGDAYVDLVVVNYNAATMSVYLGNASGTFPTKTDYATSTNPISVQLIDINGDSIRDIVVGTHLYTNVFTGAGNGTFSVKTDYYLGAGTGSYDVHLADYNTDSYLDIVNVNYSVSTVTLLRGSASGIFKLPARYVNAATTNVYDTVAGDLNNDGIMDIVTADYTSNAFCVLLGQGSGNFATKVSYAAGTGTSSLLLGDFNADGKLDVVTSHYNAANTFGISLGVGDGTFGARTDYATGTGPWQMAQGDFNRDGRMDIVVLGLSSNNVGVFIGAGNGTFAARVDYTVGTSPYDVAVGDFNNDKIPDIATANYGASTVSVLIGAGNGTFAAKVDYSGGGGNIAIRAGDMNGDGYQDLILADYTVNTVSVFLNNGNGTFAARSAYNTGTTPYGIMIGDYNGDGKLDVATPNYGSNNLSVLIGSGTGTLNTKVDYRSTGTPVGIWNADIDADGKLDFIMSTLNTNIVILPGM